MYFCTAPACSTALTKQVMVSVAVGVKGSVYPQLLSATAGGCYRYHSKGNLYKSGRVGHQKEWRDG